MGISALGFSAVLAEAFDVAARDVTWADDLCGVKSVKEMAVDSTSPGFITWRITVLPSSLRVAVTSKWDSLGTSHCSNWGRLFWACIWIA